MYHNRNTKYHQQDRYDQLQTLYQEYCASCTVCLYKTYCTFNQRSKGYTEHDDQWREQSSVLSSGYLQEYAECDQYQCTQ